MDAVTAPHVPINFLWADWVNVISDHALKHIIAPKFSHHQKMSPLGIMSTSVTRLPKDELPGRPKDSIAPTILIFSFPIKVPYNDSCFLDSPHP
jgi:hypothetical protein